MVVDISKVTLDNIHLYSLIGNTRKGQHLTSEEKNFLFKISVKPKEIPRCRRNISKQKIKLSEEERKQHRKEYQYNYYLTVTKEKRLKNKG